MTARPRPKLCARHKALCQSKYNAAPSLGIEQTEASTDEAVSVFTHASWVVTRALTTTAGSETHHQHREAGAFTWRQHASLGGGSGGSAGSPRRRGAGDTLGRKTEVRGSSEIRITARTGGELGPEVETKAGEALRAPCPAPRCPPSPPASAAPSHPFPLRSLKKDSKIQY